MIPTVLLAVVALSCLEGATSAAVSHSHRHAHQRGHVARLQETVDRLLLRQKTDHILLSTLQRAVLELQDKSQRQETPSVPEAAQTSSRVHEAVQIVEAEGRALAALGEQVAEVRGTLTEALKAEEKDDVTQLRQEIAYLRLVRGTLYSSCLPQNMARLAPSNAVDVHQGTGHYLVRAVVAERTNRGRERKKEEGE